MPKHDMNDWPKMDKKSRKQRGRRGWADSDAWSLDTYVSRVLSELLIHLRDTTHSYPAGLTEDGWSEILTEMAQGFDRWASRWDNDDDGTEAYDDVRRSLHLLRKWFDNLWD